jgi:glucose-1-phosphate adenylyltransferase
MIDAFRDKDADLMVGVVEVDKNKASYLGVIEVDAGTRVKGFAEKPCDPKTIPSKSDMIYASMGIYVFKKDILKEELCDDAKNKTSTHDFGRDIIPQMLKKNRRIFSYNFQDENRSKMPYWRDIGTIDAYYDANMDLVKAEPLFNLYDNEWPIRTYQEQFPPVKTIFLGNNSTGRGGLTLNSLVSAGCIINGGCVERSILSPNVIINSHSEVYDSILMEGVNVGSYARINKAIIDKDVNIPSRMVIGYDLKEDKKRFQVSESGIVVVAKGTEIK